jgi:predicted ferric reductase
VFALAVIGAHYALLRLMHPEVLGPADPASAPAHMTAGRIALVLFAVVVLVALVRKRVQLEYDRWRFMHALLATTAFALALWHLHGAGRFLDTAWKQWLWSAYGTFWVALIVYVRVVRPVHERTIHGRSLKSGPSAARYGPSPWSRAPARHCASRPVSSRG